jgi:hypothetical protein
MRSAAVQKARGDCPRRHGSSFIRRPFGAPASFGLVAGRRLGGRARAQVLRAPPLLLRSSALLLSAGRRGPTPGLLRAAPGICATAHRLCATAAGLFPATACAGRRPYLLHASPELPDGSAALTGCRLLLLRFDRRSGLRLRPLTAETLEPKRILFHEPPVAPDAAAGGRWSR